LANAQSRRYQLVPTLCQHSSYSSATCAADSFGMIKQLQQLVTLGESYVRHTHVTRALRVVPTCVVFTTNCRCSPYIATHVIGFVELRRPHTAVCSTATWRTASFRKDIPLNFYRVSSSTIDISSLGARYSYTSCWSLVMRSPSIFVVQQ